MLNITAKDKILNITRKFVDTDSRKYNIPALVYKDIPQWGSDRNCWRNKDTWKEIFDQDIARLLY